MAGAPHGKGARARTYPVWIGDLKESVKESDLYEAFSRLSDNLVSCRLMVDENGKSKGFGYANFKSKTDAEFVAQVMNGYPLNGNKVKTKGPSMLKLEGHTKEKIRPNSPDYRPFTDCSFFMDNLHCKKGRSCPYRHSESAKAASAVCPAWMKKQCLNKDCVYKHPGGKTSPAGKDEAVIVSASPSTSFHNCGGRCGDSKCPALFASVEDLTKHLEAVRMPQCRHCRAIFPSNVEYQDHLQSCWARSSTTSTEVSSDSPDVEVLSDTDTEEFFEEGEEPVLIRTSDSPMKGKKDRKGRPRRKLFNGERKRNESSSSDRDIGDSAYNYTATGQETSSNSYFSAFSEDESDSEDDEVVQYTPGEMARLLSLNEQDMLGSDSSGEEEGGKGTEGVAGEKLASQLGERGQSGASAHRAKNDKHVTTSTHRVCLEPVGVFWDIENCPVPASKSAFGVAAKMRREFIEGKREAEFMCVCDITKERTEVTNDLNKAQVTLVHVTSTAKNAADDKLRQSLRRFAHTYPAPATVVLISGDVNFSMELNDLMHLHNLTVVLVHNTYASDALKVFATRLVNYDDFIQDVKPPTQPHQQNLSRIVLVSGLPHHVVATRISSRLDRISDNCGGKVLYVDKNAGTARVLFRTNEVARKALKRMNGEDVFGNKIRTSMEAPSPQQTMKHLTGDALAKSFPPPDVSARPMGNMGPHTPPPPVHRPAYTLLAAPRVPMPRPYSPVPGAPPPGQFPPPPMNQFPLPPRGPPYQQPPPMAPPMPIRPQPLMAPPQRPPSVLPPPLGSLPRFPTPPNGNPQSLPRGLVPCPEGKILVFKIAPFEEPNLKQNIHMLQGHARLSAEVMILWHSYAELQVVLRLDFVQTAIMQKEDIIQALYQKGGLKAEAAAKFVETCTKSILNVLQQHKIPWDVTTCGWSSEEEENRIIRSNVINLLRRNPTGWTKFSNFKKRYFEAYTTAISEMTIHNACGGAVQILSDENSTQTQVIILYEFSPLVKVQNDTRLHSKLKADFRKLLSMQTEKKIKLLDFVTTFNGAQMGSLPTSSSGKMLQEIITSMPDVALVGNKPSNIYVTLSGSIGEAKAQPRASAPLNLAGISAAFCELVRKVGDKDGIPYKKFQQEYQSFYHRSFRVSDFLPGDNVGVRDLIKACLGVRVASVKLPSGKAEDRVCLDSSLLPSTASNSSSGGSSSSGSGSNGRPPSRTSLDSRVTGPQSIVELSAAFKKLLQVKGGNGIPLKRFQPEYQTYYHHSFKVADYLPGATAGVKELVKVCSDIKIVSMELPNGKKEDMVCLATSPTPQRSSSASIGTAPQQSSSASSGTEGRKTSSTDLDKKFTAQSGFSRLESAEPSKKKSVEDIAKDFRLLLQDENGPISLRVFQQSYQTFFHHSFKVSTYLPGNVGLKELLLQCQGIQVVSIPKAAGKYEDWVYLVKPSTSAEAGGSGSTGKLSSDAVSRFRSDCIEVLYSVEGHSLPLKQFPAQYSKVKKEPFLLVNFQAKKILHLVQAIQDVVQVVVDKDEQILKLSDQGAKKTCEKEIEVLVYRQPNHCITLDHFMLAYEKKYSRRLSHFYGHSKLLKLLEEFSKTLEIKGGGPNRAISLTKERLFACELTEILIPYREPMPISKIRPAYSEKFNKDFIVANYGYPKLIKLLEEIQDIVNIRGAGAARTVTLKAPLHYTSLFSSSSSSSSVSVQSPTTKSTSPEPLVDEVMAVLLTTHSQKMSLVELTKGYNQAFRSQGPPKDSTELLQAIQKLPNFKVTGAGPMCYVQVVQTTRKSSLSSSEAEPQGTSVTVPKSHSTGNMTDGEHPVCGTTKNSGKKKSPSLSSEQLQLSGTTSMDTQVEEAKRLTSETRRLLLCHQEHAMTFAELVECFNSKEDPVKPSAELLYQALTQHGGKDTGLDRFEISYFSADVGGSLVQLNRSDCLWKLGNDLLQLFVSNPTADLSLPVSGLETLYTQCFSRKLQTAVYGAKDIYQVLRAKAMKKVIQVDSGNKCSPCTHYKQQVLASLLTELLFVRGAECHNVESLPQLYQDHFKAPLSFSCFGVEDLSSLMKLGKVAEAINLVRISGSTMKPVLKSTTVFVEQLRHLLGKYGGQIALNQLEAAYAAEFGAPSNPEVKKYLKRKLPHFSFHVVNLASHKWVVWSPTGHPYPPQRWTGKISTLEPASSWPSFDEESFNSVLGQLDTSTSFVDDLVDLSDIQPREAGQNSEAVPFVDVFASASNSVSAAVKPSGSFSNPSCQKVSDLIDFSSDMLDLSAVTAEGSTILEEGNLDDLSFATALDVPPSNTPTAPSTAAAATSTTDLAPSDTVSEAPFDFLKQHPDLIAELSKTSSPLPIEDLTVLAEVLTLQRLKEMGIEVLDGPSPQEKVPPSQVPPPLAPENIPIPPLEDANQPVDYLKLNWSPDQVLAELQRQKAECGGVLPPDKMEPFLDYFGEMSSRELDRIEAQEGKPRPKKSVIGGKKKRNMAIRFPGQASVAPSEPLLPEYHSTSYSMGIPADQLPVADMENSSSDGSESAVPLDRNEHVRKFLKGKDPSDIGIISPDVLFGSLETETLDTLSGSGKTV